MEESVVAFPSGRIINLNVGNRGQEIAFVDEETGQQIYYLTDSSIDVHFPDYNITVYREPNARKKRWIFEHNGRTFFWKQDVGVMRGHTNLYPGKPSENKGKQMATYTPIRGGPTEGQLMVSETAEEWAIDIEKIVAYL